jgi:hypothetical protein
MVLQKLALFSLLMLVVPMSTFYGVRSLFKPGMGRSLVGMGKEALTVLISCCVQAHRAVSTQTHGGS